MATDRLLDGRLKIRHLVLVAAIADAGTLVRAADDLHVTQPVVTRGLRDVERILGIELFERLPRGVRPNAYGVSFLDHARAVLAQLRSAEEQIQLLRTGELGAVAVGTHLAGSNLLLPTAIAALKRDHPRITVTVREATPDTLQQQLLAGELDVVVGRLAPSPSERLRQRKLVDEPIRLVTRAGHPAQRLSAPTLPDLAGFPWIIPVEQTALRTELEQLFVEHGLALPQDRIECTSMLTLRQLLITTDAIAALPMFVATQDPALRLLPTPLSSIRRSVGVTVSADRPPSPATQILLHHLRAEGSIIAEMGGSLDG